MRQQPSHACALVLIPYLLLGAPEVWIRSYRRDADLADPLTLARVALEDFSGTHDSQEIAVHLKSWRVDRMVFPLEIPAERDDHSPQWQSFWTAAVLDGRLEAIY